MTQAQISLLAAALATLIVTGCSKKEPEAKAPPPATVQVVTTRPKKVEIYDEAPAQTFARNKVDVRGRVDGYIEKRLFDPGQQVSQGQALYLLDKRPFEAQLQEAKARLGEAEAELAFAKRQVSLAEAEGTLNTARANMFKARQILDRDKMLVKEGAVSRQEYDSALADFNAASATVNSRTASVQQAKLSTDTQIQSAKAKVEAQKALVEQATLNVQYCTIKAPISGLIGDSLLPVGGLVTARSDSALTTIVPLNPIFVRFKVTEAQLLKYSNSETKNKLLELFLADGSKYAQEGRIVNTLNEVDHSTGTMEVQAEFPNPDLKVLPGQFGRVRYIGERRLEAITVPLQAIQQVQSLSSVFVISDEDKVESHVVKLGPRINEEVVIEGGLEPGQRVVVEGLLGIRPGAKVNPIPATQQTASRPTSTR